MQSKIGEVTLGDNVQVLRLTQPLANAEGDDAPLFPPTYAPPLRAKEKGGIYNLSPLPGGGQRATIDSVGYASSRKSSPNRRAG